MDYNIDVEVRSDSDVILDELINIAKHLPDYDDNVIFRIWETGLLDNEDYKNIPIEYAVAMFDINEIYNMPIKKVYKREGEQGFADNIIKEL